MGQFSWYTRDGKQITVGSSVWMIYKENGTVKAVHEKSYDGYGIFDGLDYFVVLCDMNIDKIPDRDAFIFDEISFRRELGIDIIYSNLINRDEKIEYPQLYINKPNIKNVTFTEKCEDDPNQGWVANEFEYDEDDDEYYDFFSEEY